MKYSVAALAGAALLGAASAAKDKRTFAVMRFNNKKIFQGLVDPIVNPGQQSTHEHTVFGGSAFSVDATGESMSQSKCTSAKLKGDKSAYWVPTLYFHDEGKGTYEPVTVNYVNAYYFFEPTDDDLVAFPTGLSMLAGDASARLPIGGAAENLDPSKGTVNSAYWTCPRQNLDSPGWPLDSDGTSAGMQDPNNKGQGVGFPSAQCDGMYSPLRADIHFPSCYDPSKDLKDYKNNMAWPEVSYGSDGSQRQNCPKGFKHVPHILLEVYWNTQDFSDRWTPGNGDQPFVLSNGDVTGYSLHGDFLAAWDEKLLQNIIDNCDAKHAGMEFCPGVADQVNLGGDCECEGSVLSFASQAVNSLTSLPGNNLLSGFKYGAAKPMDMGGAPVAQQAGVKPGEEEEEEEVEEPAPQSPAPEPTPAEPVCVTKTKTVMETVTVFEDAPTEERKRHLHRHQARHHRN